MLTEISPQILLSLILFGSIVLFVSDKLRADLVALLVMGSLMLTGILNESQVLAGFSNSATITVACMFVLSAGLQKTGIVRWIANKLHRAVGNGKSKLLAVLMATCGLSSAFSSNTATVSVLLPVALRLSKEKHISPSKILMPLSFAAQFGGVCTLIGTSTNLLVNSIAIDSGVQGFSMFEFTKFGLICFAVGMTYMLFASHFLIKERVGEDGVIESYDLEDYLTEMQVCASSPLIGQTGGENDLNKIENIRVLEIIRDDKVIWAANATPIIEGDILLIRGDVEKVIELASRFKLDNWAENNLSEVHLQSDDISMVEIIIPSGSHIIGRSLNQLDFYWRYHAAVIAVKRRGGVLQERMAKIEFQAGDTFLLQGHKSDLEHLSVEGDLLLLKDLSGMKLNTRKALISLLIVTSVVVVAALGYLPVIYAALIGTIAMVTSKCIKASDAYDAIDMKVIIMLAGLIPLGIAMQETGSISFLVHKFMETSIQAPLFVLGGIYLITMILTALMSNAATALLIAPLSLTIANELGVDPRPFLVAVAFAASTCFTTPVGYQTNMMVYGPGGYRYSDFLKVGLPLNIIFFVLALVFIPIFWPF